MGENINLTIDPRDTQRSLNYAEMSERLRDMVARQKAAGLSARDPRHVAEVLHELENFSGTEAEKPQFIREATIDLDGYSPYDLRDYDAHLVGGKLFFGLHPNGRHSVVDLIDIDRKVVNKQHLNTSYDPRFKKPFFYNGKIAFRFKYENKQGEVLEEIVDENGESLGLPSKGSDKMILLPVLDEKNELRYLGEATEIDSSHRVGKIYDLNHRPITTEFLALEKWEVIKDQLAYTGYTQSGSPEKVAVWGDNKISLSNQELKAGNMSHPFVVQDKVVVAKWHYDFDKGGTFEIIDLVTKETLAKCINAYRLKDVNSISVVDSKIYMIASDLNGRRAITVADVLTDTISVIPDNKDTILADIQVTAGKLIQTKELRQERNGKNTVVGYSVSIGMGTPIRSEKLALSKILSTQKPKTVLGKTGQVFYIDEGRFEPFLVIDNEKVSLGETKRGPHFTYFDIVNDVLFHGQSSWIDDRTRSRTSLYIDGVKSKYEFDYILKVVEENGIYYVVAREGEQLVVREITF